jgi:hypothetical protein
MEDKICKNCWYYTPSPITKENFDDFESREDFHCCEIYDEFTAIKPDDNCKNWKSKRLNLISVTKTLFGF